MDGLNNHAEVMTKHLAKGFVDLRRERPASKSLTKLRFDHVERGFDVAALVVVRKEFIAVVCVEFKHPSPER